MEWEQLVYAWISKKENTRFNAVLKRNGEDAENLIHSWITDYVEKHEEDLASKMFYEKVLLLRG